MLIFLIKNNYYENNYTTNFLIKPTGLGKKHDKFSQKNAKFRTVSVLSSFGNCVTEEAKL